jgi:polysaccharide export outer membrane protein
MSARFLISIIIALVLLTTYAIAVDQDTVMPGDTIKITVLGEPDHSKQIIVDSSGNVSLPLVKDIHVAGLTTSEAASVIVKSLHKFLKNPDVTVEMVQKAKKQVTVAGQVKTPGLYPIESETRLMEVIGLAGGFMDSADTTKLTITRRGATEPISCNIQAFMAGNQETANLILQDGDVVMVPERSPTLGIVFVYGAVKQPGQPIQLRDGMKISQAISSAGGVVPEQADLTRAELKRKDSTSPVKVDLTKALAGDPAADLPLQPGDIISVPNVEQLGTYTIYGAVTTGGEFPLKPNLTVSKAIAAAAMTPRAKITDIRLTRHDTSGRAQAYKVNLKNISEGKTTDMVLQPGDSVFIPERPDRPDAARWLAIGAALLGVLLRN